MSARLALRCSLVAALALPALGQAPAALLEREEAALLRRAVFESSERAAAADPLEAVGQWLATESGLGASELDHLRERLRTDANLRKAILELASRRLHWRAEPRGPFMAWWDPRQASDAGTPSTGLSAEDAAALSEFLDALARELGIPVPSGIPYVVDLRPGTERVRGPRSLRWGVITSDPRDRAAVARLLLMEAGDAAYVIEALSRLRACADRDCRVALLNRARGVVIRSGYVPILDGLQASAFAEEDDPALASALLVVDRIDRLHPGRTFTALLVAVAGAKNAAELRTAFFRATGEPPGRLDKLVQVELSEWARARANGAVQPVPPAAPRSEPPPRSW